MGKTHRQALCPVCGTAHGMQVTETIPGKPYMVLSRSNYWEKTKDFDPGKPFGVIQEVGMGRGRSFKLLGYFSPEEDLDGFFPLVKNRLLQAVKEWRDKGWITEDEVRELCEYIPPAEPTPRQPALPIPEPGMPGPREVTKKISSKLRPLADEAVKYDTFDEFEAAFSREIKHGRYYHVTDNPNFTIDRELGPRDMSSMAGEAIPEKGKLMITSDLAYWAEEYEGLRQYVAIIDMSQVPKEKYWQVNRGFGNEFWVDDPSMAKVVKVVPMKQAKIDTRLYHQALPSSKEELRVFYDKVKGAALPIPEPGMPVVKGNWRQAFDETNDPSRKADILRAVAEVEEVTSKELADILDRVKGLPNEANIRWAVKNRLAKIPKAEPGMPEAKEPWQMTKEEWLKLRTGNYLDEIRLIKGGAGVAIEKGRLDYGIEDIWIPDTLKSGKLSKSHGHFDVEGKYPQIIEKALLEGKPVPPEVLATILM